MPTFLQTAFLGGLAALAVPILIHLFFRLKTKRVELGTIRFLRVVLEENARRRKVMRWLLLALRLSFVALLAVLFARPFLTASAAGGQGELLVILIDQSATMQLKSDNSRLIDLAMAEARQLIENAGDRCRVEVAFFDHDIHPVARVSGEDSGDALVSRLQAPQHLFGATNYGVAFAWARDILVNASAGSKQLHFFTDLQQSGLDWTEVEPLPQDVAAHLHDLGRAIINNVAVTEVRLPRTWVRPGEAPTLRASILHGGAFALEEVSIVMEIGRVPHSDGAQSANAGQVTENPAGRRTDFARLVERITKRERVKLEPSATVNLDFELPGLSEGLWQGRIAVEYDDDLVFDNQRYFAVAAAPAYRILVVNGGEAENPLYDESFFLEAALRLASPGETFSDSPFAPDVHNYQSGDLLPNLSNYAAVALVNTGNVSETDASSLANFVRRGGGLLVFTGDRVSASSCETLREAGLTVGDIADPHVTRDLPWRLAKWDDKHPVFEPLNDPQHGDLRRLIFAAYTKVTPAADANVIAEFNTGAPAVLERPLGNGTVIWVTTSCGRDWSDWYRSRLFLPTIHQLLGYQVGIAQGGPARMRLVDSDPKALSSSETVKSNTDSGSAKTLTAQRVRSPDPTAVPGVFQYERYSEAVNVSPRESDTERCSPKDFEDRFAIEFRDAKGDEQTQVAAMANVELRQDELWQWAACALLGVLLLEGFVGNRTTA